MRMAMQGATTPAAATTDSTEVVGRRIGALLIDSILLGVVFVIVGVASGGGHSGHGSASVHLGSGSTFAFLRVTLLYFFICEGTTGQTLGKRLLGIRVVSADGSRASLGQAAGRTLLRVVDS